MDRATRLLIYAPAVKPSENESICLISFEIARILLGGGPQSRMSFWKAYRREVELNLKTRYQNYHVRLCERQLQTLRQPVTGKVYYRGDRLVTESALTPPEAELLRELSSDDSSHESGEIPLSH
jgi:hypothetical protein